MATIKSFTSVEQSRKLAEILPIESADMRYQAYYDNMNNLKHVPRFVSTIIPLKVDIPCWSLAALLSVLPNYQLQTQDDGIGILCSCKGKFNIVTADNHIDACVAMIEKLHKLKLL